MADIQYSFYLDKWMENTEAEMKKTEKQLLDTQDQVHKLWNCLLASLIGIGALLGATILIVLH